MTAPERPPVETAQHAGGTSVAIVHNRYLIPGGEDVAVEADTELLRDRGHDVSRFDSDNRAIAAMGTAAAARATLWNREARRALAAHLAARPAVVVHFHNTFPLLSPAVYEAARDAGAAVVQTLHNYRLLCPNALLFRDGGVCEDCLPKRVKWPGVVHACYRGSRPASAATAGMLAVHRARGTWHESVDTYVALSEFARRKFVAGGLPAERLVVRPNYVVDDPGRGRHDGGYALFVGRLSEEKGIATLVAAWRQAGRGRRLKVAGMGPLAALFDGVPGVELLGHVPNREVLALMRDASFLVQPSVCYENFPMTLAEAFATGLPALVSGHGALAEIVDDGRTGRHFAPGDAAALADALADAFARPDEIAAMSDAARVEYETRYDADASYRRLRDVYALATRRAAHRASRTG